MNRGYCGDKIEYDGTKYSMLVQSQEGIRRASCRYSICEGCHDGGTK